MTASCLIREYTKSYFVEVIVSPSVYTYDLIVHHKTMIGFVDVNRLLLLIFITAAQSLHLTAGDEVRVFCPPASSAWCWLTWGGVPLCCPLLVPGGAESYTPYTSNTHANICPPHTHTMLQGFIFHFRFVLTLKLEANPCPYIFKWISSVNAFKYDQDTRVLHASITI